MKLITTKRGLSAFAVFAALALFAMCVLCVLLSGAGVYRRLTAEGQQAYARRTCAQYLATRIRQAPSAEAVEVTAFDSVQALTIAQTLEGERYLTRVYCYEGWLMELFSAEQTTLCPQDGEKLLPAESLSFVREGSLLRVTIVDEYDQTTHLELVLRGGKGAMS